MQGIGNPHSTRECPHARNTARFLAWLMVMLLGHVTPAPEQADGPVVGGLEPFVQPDHFFPILPWDVLHGWNEQLGHWLPAGHGVLVRLQ